VISSKNTRQKPTTQLCFPDLIDTRQKRESDFILFFLCLFLYKHKTKANYSSVFSCSKHQKTMGWLRLVRSIILRRLLIVATPYSIFPAQSPRYLQNTLVYIYFLWMKSLPHFCLVFSWSNHRLSTQLTQLKDRDISSHLHTHAHIHAYLYTCTCIYIHLHTHANIPAYLHTCTCIYIHT